MSELVISVEGLGPIRVGAAPGSLGPELDALVFDPDYCADISGALEPGAWMPNYPDTADGLFDKVGPPFGVDLADGVIERIDVFAAEPTTPEGIHVGSTRDELMAAYPGGFDSTDGHELSEIYVLNGPSARLVFEVSTGTDMWAADEANRVIRIRVKSNELPVGTTAGTDNVAGGCRLW